ncbi:uncharacterized protein LOC108904042 [Anoplophora glabripennis]|uniref:uncharacterized protein LOC108904042 n=1 Tax=Anoplophora glabripennis TaxID=217634 RepID=UPI000C76FCF6|nr:uncharacterized protein LOC108904042 [Anoplophora glabripennis]
MKFYQPENYEPCSEAPLLTYVTNVDNIVTLHVDDGAVTSYESRGVICCYSNVTRKNSMDETDNTVTMTECKMFESSVPIYHDTIYVRCFSREEADIVYENIHATYFANWNIKRKLAKPAPNKQISVLLVGIDSLSRLNFIRALPNTYKYVEKNGWVSLKGYNKVDDNIFPNLITILTGHNSSDINEICNPEELETFDLCPLLWNDYKELGYVTSYAEDECSMSTFNYKNKGFKYPPTDFYFRPYMLASEKLRTRKRQGLTYCSGPETSGERIMNLTKDFGITFKDHPHFGLFWMNTFSHNQLNAVTGMDNKIKDFLEELSKEQVLEHSVVIFFSAHGIRFGGIRLTETGWFEERLPFIYASFPSWFKKKFPNEYKNFKINSARLTSPYDLHMTLQHFLVLSGHDYTIIQSPSCPSCKSLLEEIDVERSCGEAGILQHWCTCSKYTHVELDKDVQNKVTAYVLNEIYKIIESHDEGWMCARYLVNNVTTSVSRGFSRTSDTYLLLKFRTMPEAVFETTINYKGDISDLNFSISGSISRLDQYFSSSNCVTNRELKKYCYCVQ